MLFPADESAATALLRCRVAAKIASFKIQVQLIIINRARNLVYPSENAALRQG